jgi:hypothetical protein
MVSRLHTTTRLATSSRPSAAATSTSIERWIFSPAQIDAEYDFAEALVHEALAFYDAHRHEIDAAIAAALERKGCDVQAWQITSKSAKLPRQLQHALFRFVSSPLQGDGDAYGSQPRACHLSGDSDVCAGESRRRDG